MRLRTVAATITNEVLEGSSLLDNLEPHLITFQDLRDRAWVQAVVFGVCRHYFSLKALLRSLLKKPDSCTDKLVESLLLVGLYQLKYMRTPSFAVVAETVNAAKNLKKTWATGLVNAVLRSYLRLEKESEDMHAIKGSMESLYDHPHWWIDRVKADWPEEFEMVLDKDQLHPPMTLRVNLRKVTREQYMENCQLKGLECVPCDFSPAGVRLLQPVPVIALPGFNLGWVSIQDEAAQLAAHLLQVERGHIILDACAAPGGKLTHLLEMYDDITVFALEKDQERAMTINENLNRLQQSATCKVGNALSVTSLFPDVQFDRILLDVPCSGSGVVRRHPDMKLLRQSADIARFAKEQFALLSAVWPALKPGGTLLYATCSVFSVENEEVISRFLESEKTALCDVIDETWGNTGKVGKQILPGMHEMDGFYYARLKKQQ